MTQDPSECEMFCKDCRYALVETGVYQCPECGREYDSENPRSFSPTPDGDAWGGVDLTDRKSMKWGIASFFLPPMAVAALGVINWVATDVETSPGILFVAVAWVIQLCVSVKLGTTFVLGRVRIVGVSGVLIVLWLFGSMAVLFGIVGLAIWISETF